MKKAKRGSLRRMMPGLLAMALAMALCMPAMAQKAQTERKRRLRQTETGSAVQQPADSTGGGAVSAFEDMGIDLVVSRVVIRRGVFSDGKTIGITPYVRNMCNGVYHGRIKILFGALEKAEWIEGGIGPKAEKAAATVYFDENDEGGLDTFYLWVDNQDEIHENNDGNNMCTGIRFGAADTFRTHLCPIAGVRCPDAPPPARSRGMETLPR